MVQVSAHKRIHGLDVNSNPYLVDNYVDRGSARTSLVIADNIVLNRQYAAGNRHGFDYFTNTDAMITQLVEYQDQIIQHENSTGSLWHGDNTTGTRTQYSGTYFAPPTHRISATVSRGSLFMTTTAGVMKLDAYTNTPVRAGLTKGLDVRLTPTGSSGFMNGFSKAAYRITWTRLDANKQLVRSDVSARVVATNNTRVNVTSATLAAGTVTITTAANHVFSTADVILIAGATQTPYNGSFTITVTSPTTFTYTIVGSPTTPATGTITAERQANVSVAFSAPWDITASDTYEVWRTVTLDAGSDPGDTEFLVVALTGATPGATVTYVDSTADSSLLNATPLYTNATAGQGGAASGNVRPPYCTTHCDYKDYRIYANTALDQQFVLTFLSVTSLVAGTSAITLTNATGGTARTYTAQAGENIGTHSFQLFTTSTPALNIEATARSLCHVINGDSTGSFYAEYTSGVTQAPGIIRIWARSPLSGAFSFKADSNTTGGQFSPTLPTSGTAIISDSDARPNRIYFSKFQQPDAVPLTNSLDIGRLDQPIKKVISVRDACFVLKSDGIWFLSGLTTPFSVTELDTNAHIIAPSTAAAVDNQVYFLSNEGFLKVSVSGAEIISFPIEPLIVPLMTLTNVATTSFGVGHLAEHLYICWLPSNSGDTYCKQAFVYHTFIKEWSRWTKPAAIGVALNTNFTLYVSSGLENALLKQRRNGDITDYSDETQAITITAQSGTALTVTWANANFTPSAGLSIHQGANVAKTTAATLVSGTTWTFTIDRGVTYTNGAATARLPIQAHVRFAPDVCNDSGIDKTFYSASCILESDTVTQATIEVGTNEAPFLSSFAIQRTVTGGWGSSWGDSWGDLDSPVRSIPFSVDIPVPDITGETLTIGWIHNVSQEPFSLVQTSLFWDANAEYEVVGH